MLLRSVGLARAKAPKNLAYNIAVRPNWTAYAAGVTILRVGDPWAR